jgi:phosphinothricin acetyltransferase
MLPSQPERSVATATEVRGATEADLPAILEIYNEVVRTSTAIYALEPSSLAERRDWFQGRLSQSYPVLVARRDAEVVGFASFGDWRGAWAGYRHTVEHTVHVRSDACGTGVGSLLVQALFPLALERGKHVMVGGIDAANTRSIRFHQRLGFQKVAHFHEVGRKFDRWLDLVFVQRLL